MRGTAPFSRELPVKKNLIPAVVLVLFGISHRPVMSFPYLEFSAPKVPMEDSLQTLLSQDPENPENWFNLGALAAQGNQFDLAESYFSEALRLAKPTSPLIVEVGKTWLLVGEPLRALPCLMPNLRLLTEMDLNGFQKAVGNKGMDGPRLVVLRHWANRDKEFTPIVEEAGRLACNVGDWAACRDILEKFGETLDSPSAIRLFQAKTFLNEKVHQREVEILSRRHKENAAQFWAHVQFAMWGDWGKVKRFLSGKEGQQPAQIHYLQALMAMADDNHREAESEFKKALQIAPDSLSTLVAADFYRFYSVTGNSFKLDQLWGDLKEKFQDSNLAALLAMQLELRGYEKQARYYFRVALRRNPGLPIAVESMWNDFVMEDEWMELQAHIDTILKLDSLSCDGNSMAMRLKSTQGDYDGMLQYARNASLICHEPREPFFELGQAYLKLNQPDQARRSFARFVQRGGDRDKIPVHMR